MCTYVCIFSLGVGAKLHTIAYMQRPSTDTQSFSSFASLNRADLTHEPEDRSFPRERMTKFVLAGVIAVVAICVFFRAW